MHWWVFISLAISIGFLVAGDTLSGGISAITGLTGKAAEKTLDAFKIAADTAANIAEAKNSNDERNSQKNETAIIKLVVVVLIILLLGGGGLNSCKDNLSDYLDKIRKGFKQNQSKEDVSTEYSSFVEPNYSPKDSVRTWKETLRDDALGYTTLISELKKIDRKIKNKSFHSCDLFLHADNTFSYACKIQSSDRDNCYNKYKLKEVYSKVEYKVILDNYCKYGSMYLRFHLTGYSWNNVNAYLIVRTEEDIYQFDYNSTLNYMDEKNIESDAEIYRYLYEMIEYSKSMIKDCENECDN